MNQIDAVRTFSSNYQKILESSAKELLSNSRESLIDAAELDQAYEVLNRSDLTGERASSTSFEHAALEAIILGKLRPARFIDNDIIVMDGEYDFDQLIKDDSDEKRKVLLEIECQKVGRLDLLNHGSLPYAGTGWLVTKDIVVTNRHVAEVFARPDSMGGFPFLASSFGDPLEQRVNFNRQRNESALQTRRIEVLEVLYMAPQRGPDIALLRVAAPDWIEPLELDTTRISEPTPVAAIGYPAEDPRNDAKLMTQIFGSDYGVKRFSPGLVTHTDFERGELHTDYSSLGGNSGSAVIDLQTRKVVGLHFAGLFKVSNYAVTADLVDAAIRQVERSVLGTEVGVSRDPDVREVTPASHFSGRDGYSDEFLGTEHLAVPLPGFDFWKSRDEVAVVKGTEDSVLRYRHFSVVQNSKRRLPLLTAVNIDGSKSMRLKRRDRWNTDGRIEPDHQIDNVLYRRNDLDRGHLVRRVDPGWGDTRQEAQEAEDDTFHYTNCAPQHKNLNQRDWLKLEDYILDAAKTKDFKVSVFSGPVFRDDDRTLKRQPGAEDVKIPESFWKVVVMVNSSTEMLSATGYVLS